MSLYLRTFAGSLRSSFVFGICPFVVDAKCTRLYRTKASDNYTLIYIIIICGAYVLSLLGALKLFFTVSSTHTFSELLTHCTITITFVGTMLLNYATRAQHKRLIESLRSMFDAHFRHRQPKDGFYKRLHALNIVCSLVYFLMPASNILLQWDATVAPFYFLFSWIAVNLLQLVVHVQNLALVWRDVSDRLTDRLRTGSPTMRLDAIDDADRLGALVGQLNACFGAQLLLMTISDCSILTNMLLSNVRRVVFETGRCQWLEVYYYLCFLLPHYAKVACLCTVVGGVRGSWRQLQAALLENATGDHRNRDGVGREMHELLCHKALHMDDSQTVRAFGILPINKSSLFMVRCDIEYYDPMSIISFTSNPFFK